eukprot:tig00021357_g20769.t1
MAGATRGLVEVKEVSRNGFYLARVLDVRASDGAVQVFFEGFPASHHEDVAGQAHGPTGPLSSSHIEYAPLERVRRVPPEAVGFVPQPGTPVEVRTRINHDEPFSYWEATVVSMKGSFAVIRYLGEGEDSFEEIVELDAVRPSYRGTAVVSMPRLVRAEFPIERQYAEAFLSAIGCRISVVNGIETVWSTDVDAELGERTGVMRVWVESEQAQGGKKQAQGQPRLKLCVVGAERAVERCRLLADSYVRQKHTAYVISKEKSALAEKLAAELERKNVRAAAASIAAVAPAHAAAAAVDGKVHLCFTVERDLIGTTIGARGANLRKAQAVAGVERIDIEDDGSVYVTGASEEAVQQARRLLEVVRIRFAVPSSLVGRIVGAKGANIQSIKEKSGVYRIDFVDSRSRAGGAARGGRGGARGRGRGRGGVAGDAGRRRAGADEEEADFDDDASDHGAEAMPTADEELASAHPDSSIVHIVGPVDAAEGCRMLIEQQLDFLPALEKEIEERNELNRRLSAMTHGARGGVMFRSTGRGGAIGAPPGYPPRGGARGGRGAFARGGFRGGFSSGRPASAPAPAPAAAPAPPPPPPPPPPSGGRTRGHRPAPAPPAPQPQQGQRGGGGGRCGPAAASDAPAADGQARGLVPLVTPGTAAAAAPVPAAAAKKPRPFRPAGSAPPARKSPPSAPAAAKAAAPVGEGQSA